MPLIHSSYLLQNKQWEKFPVISYWFCVWKWMTSNTINYCQSKDKIAKHLWDWCIADLITKLKLRTKSTYWCCICLILQCIAIQRENIYTDTMLTPWESETIFLYIYSTCTLQENVWNPCLGVQKIWKGNKQLSRADEDSEHRRHNLTMKGLNNIVVFHRVP